MKKRIGERENKDRTYWEESVKKQELWKSEIPNLLKSYRRC